MKNKNLIIIMSLVALILCIPLIAMQFTDEVNWSAWDFTTMAVLLSGMGISIDLVWRKTAGKKSRIVLIVIVAAIFLLLWLELAVGIINTPIAGS
jgi:hypothetical protein